MLLRMEGRKLVRPPYKGGLKRLDDSFYRGFSYVHWTMTLKDRATGWLDAAHHESVRTILFHTMARESMCCPAYCLMPDHAHFLFVGFCESSDQSAGVAWMRREWNKLLAPMRMCLQHQPFDEVISEADRKRAAFPDFAGYILRNPERCGFVETWSEWPYLGAVFAGYPKMDPRKAFFWNNFWAAYSKHAEATIAR